MSYETKKPEAVEGFQDQKGRVHATYEEAEKANFRWDLTEACNQLWLRHQFSAYDFETLLKFFVSSHPDMAERLIKESRDGRTD